MPAVTSGKVLVTGANGFIGTWTVKAFLDAGFAVRGTIRDVSKAKHLKELFRTYGDKLEFAVISDMTKVSPILLRFLPSSQKKQGKSKGVASPTNLSADDPDEQIVPAVQGTLAVLKAAESPSASPKRVVYLCSCAAVIDPLATGPRVYDESSWNDADVAEVQRNGRAAPQLSKYRASKTHAERSAWAFAAACEKRGEQGGWDLTVVNPPWVFGPVIHEVGKGVMEGVNDSNKYWYSAVVKGKPIGTPHSWIDVRDLAHSLVLAVATPAAGGERFIVASGPFRWEDFVITASHISMKTYPLMAGYDANAEYRSMEETTRDILKDYEGRDWL